MRKIEFIEKGMYVIEIYQKDMYVTEIYQKDMYVIEIYQKDMHVIEISERHVCDGNISNNDRRQKYTWYRYTGQKDIRQKFVKQQDTR